MGVSDWKARKDNLAFDDPTSNQQLTKRKECLVGVFRPTVTLKIKNVWIDSVFSILTIQLTKNTKDIKVRIAADVVKRTICAEYLSVLQYALKVLI